MIKIDFKKEFKHLYQILGQGFSSGENPLMQFLMLDGRGDPNTAQEYQDAIEALYAVAYRAKIHEQNS